MLFDLRGKRKRMIQVIYAFLALLIAFGLVGLGIGGSASGGILDALGLSGNSSNSDPQFQQQIDNANSTLQTKPKDTRALITLARYSYLNGQQEMGTNDQGVPVPTDSAISSFNDATDAWERYLEALPKSQKPNPSLAALISRAYANVASTETNPQEFTRQFERAGDAASISAAAHPNPSTWLQAAAYYYFAGKPTQGKAAGQKALRSADSSSRKAVQNQLDQFEKQSKQIQKALKQSGPTKSQLQNPLAPLGGSSGLSGGTGIPGG